VTNPKIPSERRIITILAVDIVGSTQHIADCDPDDAQLFFDRCFDHIGKVAAAASGTLVSFEGDGGIAAFGWPDALEDHADRACLAAWDIQHSGDAGLGPGGRPVQYRVGVHSGLVALRELRRGGRSRFNTVGATVHIAAKLQQCASAGGILVSREVARLCRFRLMLAPNALPPSLSSAGTEAFSLETRPESPRHSDVARRYSSPMIGRQPELARLTSLLPRPGGDSGAIALIGEPGIGKSRLAAAAIAEALALNARILVFFGDSQQAATPFAAARSLIGESLGLAAGIDAAAIRAALDKAPLDEGEVAAVETLLASPKSRSRPARSGLTDTQLARLLVKAFCALAIDRPTLLLIEDLQVVDAESRRFLRLLAAAETIHPLCLLLTGRPESLQDAREIAPLVFTLEPLSRNAMKALSRLLWPDGRATQPMIDRLVDRAEGVPFVLEEMIHSLGDKLRGGSQILPQGVESLIHARLQRLSPSARALAQALSLLGENVDVAFASAVIGLDSASLLDDLEELERFAFVHPRRGDFTYMRHQIIAEACADTIPREQRKAIHRASIQALTSLYPSLGGRYGQLAFHAEGAGDPAAALAYLWEAALEARRSSATASINLIFDRAIDLVERMGDDAQEKYVDFVLMAFASMVQLGEFDKMNRHLPRVMGLGREMGRPAVICSTLSQLGMICWFEGRYQEGLSAAEEGLAIARSLQSPALIFSNQFMLANNLHGMGSVARAIEVGLELCDMLGGELETARLGAAGIPRATMLSFMSWFMMDVGAYEEGLEFAEEGLAVALREQEPYSEVLARHGLAHNLLMLHRDSEAVDCLTTAREISERNGYDAIKANLAGRMAIALSRTGRPGEAIEIVEDCLRKKLHLRTGQLERYYLRAGYAEALLRSGAVDRGLAALGEALEIARGISNPCLIVNALGLRAWLLIELRPGDAQIERDLAERDRLCSAHGLVAWPSLPASGSPAKSDRSAQPARS
jgi:class 3 adenylate cyclase/tetratricopeptide (TPR) repeat protein